MFCIHYSTEGQLGSFQLLAIINKAAMNIVEHVSLLHARESSGYIPRSGIVASSGFLKIKQKPSVLLPNDLVSFVTIMGNLQEKFITGTKRL